MRTLIIRDDDTNALTPVECLEKLYRPFLDRGLPVNLATIPEVRTDVKLPDGRLEGFLAQARRPAAGQLTVPLAEGAELVEYLHANPGFRVVQHGCHHDTWEFDLRDRREVVRRLDYGAQRLREAGFSPSSTFVAPHDKISRVAYEELARRFQVISTGWFEWRRIPARWLPRYFLKKLFARKHWRVGTTKLLSHPGCLLSYQRPYDTMLETIQRTVAQQDVTVLVTHWWEYFRNGHADEKFIRVLHDTAAWLAAQPDLRVISFDDFAAGKVARQSVTPLPFAPTLASLK